MLPPSLVWYNMRAAWFNWGGARIEGRVQIEIGHKLNTESEMKTWSQFHISFNLA